MEQSSLNYLVVVAHPDDEVLVLVQQLKLTRDGHSVRHLHYVFRG